MFIWPVLGDSHTHLDRLKNNASSTLVLEFHQLLSMFPLLIRGLLEVVVKSLQSYVITVKVESLESCIKP